MLLIDVQVNKRVVVGQTMLLTVVKITDGEVILEMKTTGDDEIYSDGLFLKLYTKNISEEAFNVEKNKKIKRFDCRLGEKIRIGQNRFIEVLGFPSYCRVKLGFEAEGLEILREDILIKRASNLLRNHHASTNA